MSIVENIVGRMNVADPESAVVREMYNHFKPAVRHDPKLRDERKKCYRAAIKAHLANREMYRWVMSGLH